MADRRWHRRAAALALALAAVACTAPTAGPPAASPPSTSTSTPTSAPTTAPGPGGPGPGGPGAPPAREQLARMAVDDAPRSADGYRRSEWPHWRDIDGDGCDARQQALVAASRTPAQVDIPCTVVTGDWVSAYDGKTTTNPGDLDVDHVVPLEEAHRSGGWAWSTDQRTRYANDQADLWVVSAASNRSKGAKAPDRWRPPDRSSWCTYARRWIDIKVRWQLTATTAERDALGQMLDTCP